MIAIHFDRVPDLLTAMAASAQVLKVRCKHRVIFREAKQGRIVDTSVGELYSFYDDITGSFLAEKDNLVVEGYEKPENLPGLSSSTTKVHFYFGVSESETNKELLKFLNFLRQNTKYVGKIRFDESAGYLRAFPPAGEAADIGGFRKGFKCTIYKDMRSMHEWVRSKVREIMKVNSDVNLRANVPSAVTLPPPPSPTQLPPVPEKKLRRGVSINIENNQEILIESRYAEKDKNEVHSLSQVQMDERGINKDDSGAAAKEHYNKTVRNKALRHHSNMYHLRNINNFVKGMVIEEASDIIAKRSKHLAVLDLACGKGGDMLKWIHNKRIGKYFKFF